MTVTKPPPYALPAPAADATGLTAAEAEDRLTRFGRNDLPPARRRGPVTRFLLQFHSPLIYVLLVSAAASALLGERIDAAVIFGVVVINAIVGFAQESRAEAALAALAALGKTTATVIRDGSPLQLESGLVVPGDLVVLDEGIKVPADLRIVQADGLTVDESALTGESMPVRKDPAELPPDTPLGDRWNMAYSSTLVTRGAGRGVVVATGAATELGAVQRLVSQARGVQTPLTRKIAHFSGLVTVAILALAAGTFLIGVLRGQPSGEMLTAAIALAVGAIPEGLPAVVTITLAFGVARMVHRNVIVRRLPAVETLGSTTVICTDKTGTLTENQMTVTTIIAAGTTYSVTEMIQADGGQVRLEDHPALAECLRAGLSCNDARLADDGTLIGDPTETALVVSATKAGLPAPATRLNTLPFASERQYMATHHEDGTVYLKGSVERILALCDTQLNAAGEIDPVDASAVHQAAETMGGRALRVLAFARCRLAGETVDLAELPRLTFLGLQAMHDPPRQAAAASIKACQNAGIQVKMITGDHAATARAIGRNLGLTGSVMTGAQLAACPDEDLPLAAEDTAIFARVSPEQKLRIVLALQRRSHVIAMTGDGVNDAPALKQADIGIAMGQAGTEVAKESADMILTDDNFTSIEAAVEEGRGVFDNLVKFITWALPANLGLGLVLVAAILLGTDLPILPVQVLWLNMTAVLILGLPFAVEPVDPTIMRRPPRDPAEPLIRGALVVRILLVSAILVTGAFGLFHWELGRTDDLAQARTVVVNVFAMTLLTYLFNCLSLDRPVLWNGVRRNPWVGLGVAALIAIQVLYTYAPFMNEIFRSAPLGPGAWAATAFTAVAAYLAVELTKFLQRPRDHQAGDPEGKSLTHLHKTGIGTQER